MEREREINEARDAAQQALDCLRAAQQYLNSAGNWGIVDLLFGGFITTFIKHNKMDSAQEKLTEARFALRQLQKELDDIDKIADIRIDVGDFLKFADYFFDGVIADWLVQSRINEAKRQVEEAIRKVQDIQKQLSCL